MWRRTIEWFAVAAACAGCGAGAGSHRNLPAQVALELSGGAIDVPDALAPRLSALGVRSFFVPAIRAVAEGSSVRFDAVEPPKTPYALPVYVEVLGIGDFDPYFAAHKDGAADEFWSHIATVVSSNRYGSIAGLHLSLRVAEQAGPYAAAVASLRRKLPRTTTLSASVFSHLTEDQAKGWADVCRKLDFVVPEVFGRVEDLDPAGVAVTAELAQTSELGSAVVPGYAPQSWGVFHGARAGAAIRVSDPKINDLSEDRRFDFAFGDLLSSSPENEYIFTVRQPVATTLWGGSAAAGDTVTFHENRLADLASALAAGRAANARVVRLSAFDDQDNLVGFSVIEDLLLGHELTPRITYSRDTVAGGITLVTLNSSSVFSELSRMNNWFDLRVEGSAISDVRPGDFDRYQFVDASGNSVPAARARSIRFFENFIAPGESMTTGAILCSPSARFFASAHFVMPDGRIVVTPEAEVAALPGEEPPKPDLPQKKGRARQRLPRR